MSIADVKREKAAYAASLCRRGTAILGKSLRMEWIPEEESALGYTSCAEPKTVYVAWTLSPYFDVLDEDKAKAFRGGVFAHELLHQCYTDFDYTNAMVKCLKNQGEAAILMEFCNILEDPAIEYFAPNKFGGWLLNSLNFSIKHIYKMSPPIGDEPTPYRQLVNALINFGDMGMVKGHFTFPEAKEYFIKVAPLFNEGIECPDPKKRIDIARECFEICRPLWEEDLKMEEIMKKLLEELMKSLEREGSPSGEGDDGEGSPSSGSSSSSSSASAKRRKKAVKKMTGAGKGKGDKEKSDSKGGSDEDSEESDSKDGSGEDSDSKDGDSSDEGDASGKEEAEKGDSDEKAEAGGSDSATPGGDPDKDAFEYSPDEADEVADTEAEKSLSSEDVESIKKAIDSAEKEAEREAKRESKEDDHTPPPDYTIGGIGWKDRNSNNGLVTPMPSDAGHYAQLTSQYSWDIRTLFKSLKKIFETDKEEERRSTSGAYNIMRGSIGCSAKIFDKRKDPNDKKDVCVVLAIDQSGSMRGENINSARKAAIVFAEALDKLHIPYYIVGYSADEHSRGRADHRHFVTWKSSKKAKTSLCRMQAHYENFDGYSIRYAAKLLEGRREKYKLLFVISDGAPACSVYDRSSGIEDTIMAVKDARKIATTVFGIGLGHYCPTSLLQRFYGSDFIGVSDPSLLTTILCKKLEKVIKR